MYTTARLFQALGDETRLRILSLIYRQELCVSDIAAVLGLPQSRVAKHLAWLCQQQLVMDRRRFSGVVFRTDPELPEALMDAVMAHLRTLPEVMYDAGRLDEFRQSGSDSSLTPHLQSPHEVI